MANFCVWEGKEINLVYVTKKMSSCIYKTRHQFSVRVLFGFFQNLDNSNIMFSLLYPKMNHWHPSWVTPLIFSCNQYLKNVLVLNLVETDKISDVTLYTF